MRYILILGVLMLGACGADGPPERPTKTGIALSGEVQMGVRSN
ncbi:MAG: argininosuccinate lyase [Rhodobacteraceae bacterium]|nr:argininosuccinate lyase [Paracoccaceae bacterium]MCF8512910.1 argininosuccinate lyase [Paracoccaceae bacterium]MCF8517155.1 argininosuccinate lyase [Paracoccaceae bacterium]